jgi:hypothetical protein
VVKGWRGCMGWRVWTGSWPEGGGDQRRESDESRDAVKGLSAKVHFVWTLAYAVAIDVNLTMVLDLPSILYIYIYIYISCPLMVFVTCQ